MTGRDQTFLRGQLASVGIVLDPAVPSTATCASASSAPRAPVDPDEVRAILVAAGAPATDLKWLVPSCRSIEDARGYRAPARSAWCFTCDGVTASDTGGCITCRGEDPNA